jgi:hypothetical protein
MGVDLPERDCQGRGIRSLEHELGNFPSSEEDIRPKLRASQSNLPPMATDVSYPYSLQAPLSLRGSRDRLHHNRGIKGEYPREKFDWECAHGRKGVQTTIQVLESCHQLAPLLFYGGAL